MNTKIFIGMKSLIKSLLRESLLNEKLADVDSDVDLLYDKYFKADIDEIQQTGYITKKMFKYDETNTVILKSKESVESDDKNRCVIEINAGSNSYSPNSRIISIGVNNNALNYVMDDYNGNLEAAINQLASIRMRNSLRNEFTAEKIKGSIHHELAHWIDDTLHNQHIKSRVNKAMELGARDLGGIPVNATKMEIQGQIHNIKQLYNKHKDVWDTLTFDDLINLSPSINNIADQLKGDVKTKWLRGLKTRMSREGLLGKLMY